MSMIFHPGGESLCMQPGQTRALQREWDVSRHGNHLPSSLEDGPLHEGEVDGVTIICPWHRYDFTVKTGECSMDSDLQVPTNFVMTEDNDVLLEVT
jgi:Rieske 2Fe-2S protein